ncbi:MAG: hypothetical protein WA632_04180 [Gallionella sp.]
MATRCELPPNLSAHAETIVGALKDEVRRLDGIDNPVEISVSDATFTKVIDPVNQRPGYEGVWRNSRNERCGTLTFNSDGSFYAEYDLFFQHPGDKRWFVEMVTAWGRDDLLRVEMQMMPSL